MGHMCKGPGARDRVLSRLTPWGPAGQKPNEEGRTLSSFSVVKTIEIENAGGIVFNNFLWI